MNNGVQRHTRCVPVPWSLTSTSVLVTRVVHLSVNRATSGTSMVSTALFTLALRQVIHQDLPMLSISTNGSSKKLAVSVFVANRHIGMHDYCYECKLLGLC